MVRRVMGLAQKKLRPQIFAAVAIFIGKKSIALLVVGLLANHLSVSPSPDKAAVRAFQVGFPPVVSAQSLWLFPTAGHGP